MRTPSAARTSRRLDASRALVGAPALIVGWALAAAPSAPSATPYPDAPPAAHTGGFGEPTCHACHFDQPPDEPGGSLAVAGIPPLYTTDSTYRLTVRLARREMSSAGFQLAARFAAGRSEGRQAGSLDPLGDRVATVSADDIQYVHHTLAGTALARPGVAEWTVRWTPPAATDGPIAFHVTANASNGDRSEFGDFVYVWRSETRPASLPD